MSATSESQDPTRAQPHLRRRQNQSAATEDGAADEKHDSPSQKLGCDGMKRRVFRGLAEHEASKLEVTRSKRKDGWWYKSENLRDEGQSRRQGLVPDTKRDVLASATTREGSRESMRLSHFPG